MNATPTPGDLSARLFRKKPVVIEAVQLDGTLEAFEAAVAFMGGAGGAHNGHLPDSDPHKSWLYIDTPEGQMTAKTGDWIIRGVNGEFYPCKPDIFAATYEDAALSALPAGGGSDSPEDLFEAFVQDAIAKSPEPLRELGEYLGVALDEDKFPRANALLLQLATAYTTPQPSAAEGECSGYCCPGCGRCYQCHKQALECATKTPDAAVGAQGEWPMFTWSGLAPRKLGELRKQGWAVNGYALYRNGERGLIDLHGAVHWIAAPADVGAQGEAASLILRLTQDADTLEADGDEHGVCQTLDDAAAFLRRLAAPAAGKGVDDAARRLLADAYKADSLGCADSGRIRHPRAVLTWQEQCAIKAVKAALTRQPVAGDGWIERAARCAEEILRGPLIDVPPEERTNGFTTGVRHLAWMATKLAAKDVGSETKTCRWLGYLQGGLVTLGYSTLDTEKQRNLRSAAPAATPTDGGEGKS